MALGNWKIDFSCSGRKKYIICVQEFKSRSKGNDFLALDIKTLKRKNSYKKRKSLLDKVDVTKKYFSPVNKQL